MHDKEIGNEQRKEKGRFWAIWVGIMCLFLFLIFNISFVGLSGIYIGSGWVRSLSFWRRRLCSTSKIPRRYLYDEEPCCVGMGLIEIEILFVFNISPSTLSVPLSLTYSAASS